MTTPSTHCYYCTYVLCSCYRPLRGGGGNGGWRGWWWGKTIFVWRRQLVAYCCCHASAKKNNVVNPFLFLPFFLSFSYYCYRASGTIAPAAAAAAKRVTPSAIVCVVFVACCCCCRCILFSLNQAASSRYRIITATNTYYTIQSREQRGDRQAIKPPSQYGTAQHGTVQCPVQSGHLSSGGWWASIYTCSLSYPIPY